MNVTYYGHSCFAVETPAGVLLFDPFITPNDLAKAVDVDKVRADFILVSHGHADHIADAVRVAKRTGATVIANWEIVQWLAAQGVENGHPMNHGGRASFPFGAVKCVVAQHSSSLPDGAYGGNPCGFVVETSQGAFYYSGDTALTLDMKLIGESFQLRFAALCVGDNFTMGHVDAIRAAEFTGARNVLGVHYDTFPPIRIDRQAATAAFAAAGRRLHLPKIGETIPL